MNGYIITQDSLNAIIDLVDEYKSRHCIETVRGGKAISVLGDTIKNISPLSLAPQDDDELMNCDGCKWKDTFRSGFCAKCKRRYIEDYYEAQ